MSDVDVLEWDTECWKCERETPVVWPEEGHLNSDVGEKLSGSR